MFPRFTFTVPPGLNTPNMPVYSGKVLISGSNGEELGIPYFGRCLPYIRKPSDLSLTVQQVLRPPSERPYQTSGITVPCFHSSPLVSTTSGWTSNQSKSMPTAHRHHQRVTNILTLTRFSFTFNISYDSQDFPKLNSEFAWGSEELRWDVCSFPRGP